LFYFSATVVVDDHTYWSPVMSETIRHYMDFTEDDGRSCHNISFKEPVDPQPQTEDNNNNNGAKSLQYSITLIGLLTLWIVNK